jgi:hypothetical protein
MVHRTVPRVIKIQSRVLRFYQVLGFRKWLVLSPLLQLKFITAAIVVVLIALFHQI